MQIWPAIDLRGGKCVRLRQGDYQQETVFADDPAAVARQFADARRPALAHRRSRRGPRGAARQSAERAGDSGSGRHRVRAGRRHPRRAIDLRAARFRPGAAGDRHVGAHRAGVVSRRVPPVSRQAGAGHRRPRRPRRDRRLAEHERRDGASTWRGNSPASRWPRSSTPTSRPTACWPGPNVAAMAEMQAAVDVPVIASGGVTTADDVARLAAAGLAGCIIGRALVRRHVDARRRAAGRETAQVESACVTTSSIAAI